MMPGLYDFTIEQGCTFGRTLTWTNSSNAPVDLSGYSADMQVLQLTGPSGGASVLDLSTINGLIVLGGTNGTVTMTVPFTTTANLTPGTYQYQLTLTSISGVVTDFMEGLVLVTPAVSSFAPATHYSMTATSPETHNVPFVLTVQALDANNANVTSYRGTIVFSTGDPIGVLPSPSTLTGGNNFFAVNLKTVGTWTIGGIDTVTLTITGVTGPITVN